MAAKLKDDEIRWILSINGSEAIGTMNRLKKESDELIKANKEIQKEMAKLEKQGMQNSKRYQEMAFDYQENTKQIRKNYEEAEKLRKELKLSEMTTAQLRDRAKELSAALQNTSLSADPKAYKALQKQLDGVNRQMILNKKNSQSLMSVLAASPGPIGAAAKGVGTLKIAFQALGKVGIVLIITAIISALVSLTKGLQNVAQGSEETGRKFSRALAPVKAIVNMLKDGLIWFADKWADVMDFIWGGVHKLVGWLALIPGSIGETFKEIHEKMDRQYKIEEASFELDKERRELMQENKKLEVEMADLRLKSAQKDKYSIEERKKFVDQYIAKENEHFENEVKIAKRELDLAEERAKQAKNSAEENEELSNLRIKLSEAQLKKTEALTRIEERRKVLLQQESDSQRKSAEEEKTRIKEHIDAIDEQTKREQLALQEKYIRGELMESVYHKRSEDLVMESFRRKLEIYNLDAETRKKLELEVYEYRVKLAGETLQHISQWDPVSSAEDSEKRVEKIREKANDSLKKSTKDSLEIMKEDAKRKEEIQKRYNDMALDAAASFGDMLGSFMTASKEESAQYQYEMLMLALDTLRQIVMMATAEIVAHEVAKKSFLGLATAAALTAAVNLAFAAVKSAIKKPSVSGSSSTETSSGNTSKGRRVVSGFAEGGYTGSGGKYDVAGYLPDGRPYHRGEYFVPQEELAIPVVAEYVRRIESIRRLRTNANPLPDGFAEGGYSGSDTSGQESGALLQELRKAVKAMQNIKARVVLSDFDRAREREILAQKPFSRNKNK